MAAPTGGAAPELNGQSAYRNTFLGAFPYEDSDQGIGGHRQGRHQRVRTCSRRVRPTGPRLGQAAATGENGEGGIEVIIRQVVEGGDEALDARVIDRDAPKPLGHTLGHKRY